MVQNTIKQALLKAEELGLDLPVGVLEEVQRFDGANDFFSEVLAATCDEAIDLLQSKNFIRLANQLHAACVELCPESFSS